MTGYFKDEKMTKETLTADGFLKTGDEGYIDDERFLKITGRVKDIFKTAKGKYVAPSPIEMKFSTNHDVEQVCIVGSGLPQPIALIILSEKGKKRKAEAITDDLKITLKNINSTLDGHEKLDKVIVLQEDWTIENNLLTPSFKIKRNEIEKKYTESYASWLNCKGDVTWQK